MYVITPFRKNAGFLFRRKENLRLVEEPTTALAAGSIAALDRGGRRGIAAAATQRLGDAATSAREAEAASTTEAAGAASFGSLEALLDGSKLNLEPREGGSLGQHQAFYHVSFAGNPLMMCCRHRE